MAKVTFEFDYHEDSEDLEKIRQVNEMYYALVEIHNMCRNELKHGDELLSDQIEQLLADIKIRSGEFIFL